ncbi:MAG: hypothetical protein V4689_15125 [Verrucomicrobiota bacterium]
MKTILFAALAAAATLAPLSAEVKAKPFVVKTVTVVTVSGKIPPGFPAFKKQDIVNLKISPKELTGPQKIDLPIKSKSITSDVYYKGTSVLNFTEATVYKNATTKKVTRVDLTVFAPVKVLGNVTAPGQVTYSFVPKR